MIRTRLREAYPDEAAFYAGRYPEGYQHAVWPDHVERIAATVAFAAPWLDYYNITSVADPSAGDGALVRALLTAHPRIKWTYVGDLNPSPELIEGWDILKTGLVWAEPTPTQLLLALDELDQLRGTNRAAEPVDLLVCSETLEHLDDPDAFLVRARTSARSLLVTTPENETGADNPEHYWGWDSEAVSAMLHSAGWRTVDHKIFQPLTADTYRFQMWMAHR